MAIFKESGDKSEPRGAASGEGALSIIAAGMTVTGDIESSGVVKIEGRVVGTIRSARQVLVGRQGVVQGDVETREAIIGGTVQGNVVGHERVEVQTTASITGDVTTKTIVVHEGGRLNGAVRMTDAAPAAQSGTRERETRERDTRERETREREPKQPAVAVVR